MLHDTSFKCNKQSIYSNDMLRDDNLAYITHYQIYRGIPHTNMFTIQVHAIQITFWANYIILANTGLIVHAIIHS